MKSSVRWSASLAAAVFAVGTAFGALITLQLKKKKKRKRKRTATEHLWEIVSNSFTGALIHAGDRLGLFDLLYKHNPATPKKLADETGWSERWLTELLSQMAAAGICSYNGTNHTFALLPDYADLLRDPDQAPESIAGMFQFLLPLVNRSAAVVQSVQTGIGVSYDWENEQVSLAMDRKNRNWFYHHMMDKVIVPTSVPSTNEPLVQMLERGVNAADVGCGCGASTVALAKRFPKSQFYAYESSPSSLQVLQQRIVDYNLTNVTVCDVAVRRLGDGPNPTSSSSDEDNTFSFVYAHDVIHDMPHPREFFDQVRKRLDKTSGCWIIVDVPCHPDLARNIHQPGAPLWFGYSCLLCLASATSSRDGQGLGTCGFPASLCQKWAHEAGFEHFEKRTVEGCSMDSCFVLG